MPLATAKTAAAGSIPGPCRLGNIQQPRPHYCLQKLANIRGFERMPFDHARFILAETRVLPVPLVPEIRLHVADEATDLWERTEAELGSLNLPPPFWAFPWPGGQALARFILDRPELVAGKCVLDFAAGSGLVAIAAKKAGAAQVVANDIDVFAQAAIALNAAENGVSILTRIGDLIGIREDFDVVLAGDIAYEQDTAARVTNWLQSLAEDGTNVLVGDPRRTYLAVDRLTKIASYDVPVPRALEDADVKSTGVYCFHLEIQKSHVSSQDRRHFPGKCSSGENT